MKKQILIGLLVINATGIFGQDTLYETPVIRKPSQPGGTFRMRIRENLRKEPFGKGDHLISSGVKRFGISDGITAAYISYERRFLYNRVSVAISPQFGINRESLGGSISLRYTPRPNTRVNFMIGNDLQLWTMDQKYSFRDNGSSPLHVSKRISVGAVMINTGAKINLTQSWVMIPEVGLGLPVWGYSADIQHNGQTYSRERLTMESAWLAQMAIGYRF